MENGNILDDYIKKEIIHEEKNYEHALVMHKPLCELKRIQERIIYLKATEKEIQRRYQNSFTK